MKHPLPTATPQSGERAKRVPLSQLKIITPRLLAFSWPHWQLLAVGFVALVAASGINLFFPYFLRQVLNGSWGVSLESDLSLIALSLIGLFVVQAFCFYVRHYSFATVGQRVVATVRERLFAALMDQDIAFFDTARVGDLQSRLSSDTQLLQSALSINISVALRYLLQALGGLVLLLYISPKLTVVILLLVPLLLAGSRFWGMRLAARSRQMQQELGEAAVVAEEALSAVRLVRIFAGKDFEVSRYGKAIGRSRDAGISRSKLAAAFSSSMVFVIHSSIAIVLWIGASMVKQGSLSLGDLTAFALYCVIVAVSLGFLIGAIDEFLSAIGASERIFEILDRHPTVVAPANPQGIDQTAPQHLELRHVTFAYPTRPDLTVLDDISFEVAPGATVAIVGPSGSGKSTIAALISRFYDPNSGELRYRGTPLQHLDPNALRGEISVVPQEPVVFSVSIAENIRYGRATATQAEVEGAARLANIAEFIESLPNGYDTLVGDRGIQLSGGQRQRIAIARAVLKDPKLLILDEATSALDSENEKLVQAALSKLMEGRTTLIIAHRLSTVQHADIVLVMRSGKIIQRGSHSLLLAEPGLYRTLVEHQMLS